MKFLVNQKDVAKLFLPKQKDSHKGNFGTLVIIGGCQKYAGAPYLATLGASALRVGTGIIKIAVPQFLVSALQHRVTECTIFPLKDKGGYICLDQNQFEELTTKTTAIICGMGIGDVEETAKTVKFLIDNANCPLLFDADALNAISKDKSILQRHKQQIILTPHIGEMARLTGLETAFVKQNKEQVATAFAKEYNVIVHLKDSQSITTDGTNVATNTTGTPSMAKGGSGDVLSGIIGALLCLGLCPFDAASLGAYIHGKAGDIAAEKIGKPSLVASDIANSIADVLKKV